MPLSDETLQLLLAKASGPIYAQQIGPLRWYPSDKPRRCVNRGCGSVTPYRLNGLPKCLAHAISEMNEMLIRAGFTGYEGKELPKLQKTDRLCSATTYMKVDCGWWFGSLECIHGIKLDEECYFCDNKIYNSDLEVELENADY